ncbi:hypothetical protein Tco_0050611 [Tanacetum coccineum]
MPLFKTAGLLCNKFKEGKDKFMLVPEIRVMLLVPGETRQEGKQGLLNAIIVKTDDLDAYDFDCDDISSAKMVHMANLLSCDSDVLSEYSKLSPIVDYPDDEITSDSNIILYSQYLEETQQAIVQNTNTSAQQNSMILSMFEQMSNHATNWDKTNNESKIVNESLTTELDR